MLPAYDMEKRLQAQQLNPKFSVGTLGFEPGRSYFDSTVKKVLEGISGASAEINRRSNDPYSTGNGNQ
jgi:hypothetical protein